MAARRTGAKQMAKWACKVIRLWARYQARIMSTATVGEATCLQALAAAAVCACNFLVPEEP